MASDNLNRVFIKAYDKGKPAVGQSPKSTQGAAAGNAYAVRFDTATAHPTPPHLLTQQAVRQQAPTVAQPNNLTNQAPAPMPIAAEQFQYQLQPQYQQNALQASEAATASLSVPNVQQSNYVQPQSPYAANQAGSGMPGGSQSVSGQQPWQDVAPHTSQIQPSTAARRDVQPARLDDQIAAKNRDGGIFRLDRPSYVQDTASQDPYIDSDCSEQSAVIHQLGSHSDTSQDAQTHRPNAGPRSGADQMSQAMAKERQLRQARSRIFNPLWEVDRLEWPWVCNQLLDTIGERSSAIAQHLLEACQDGLQVLAVTSPQGGTGTSTVACCLAMLAGKRGLNVALVDGNTENPSLCYQTNLELEVDWQEALARQLPLEEIAVHSVEDQVTLVPLLERLSAPSLDEHSMALMLQELSQSFDLVLVDLGHMSVPRSLVYSLGELGALSAVVAVVDRRHTSTERLESCLRQIRQTGISSIGLIENFAA
ncbi:MAG: hypothetical protein KF752_18140 [Pirellulaceae bacterium]|nr:hypothetical protein [Pirellulaceae bacterium]